MGLDMRLILNCYMKMLKNIHVMLLIKIME